MFPEIITELLQDGYKVSFRAPGHSMFPTIMANETIVVEPIEPDTVKPGDIILYRTNGRLIAHRVICIQHKVRQTALPIGYPRNTEMLPFIEVNGYSVKRSAPQAKCSSNEVLNFVLRGDASATIDEPVTVDQILGKVISVERDGCRINPYSFSQKLAGAARRLSLRIKSFLN
jgi:hypothetical protein